MKTRSPRTAAIFLAAALWAPGSRADNLDELRQLHDSTVNLVKLLVQQGVISQDKADAIIQQAQQVADQSTPSPAANAPAQPAAATEPATPAANSATAAGATATANLPGPVTASGTNPSTAALIDLLVDQGVISTEQAAALIEQAKKNPAAVPPAIEVVKTAPAAPKPSVSFSYKARFDERSARLPDDRTELDRIVALLRKSKLDKMEVTGYTDGREMGSADDKPLSQARARAVAEYLAGKLSLPMEQIVISGKGAEDPAASNDTADGRAKNRRVEVLVAAELGVPPEPRTTVHVQYVPEAVKQQIRDEVKEEVLAQAKHERWGDPGALPDWIYRISWAGDFRLRGETDLFPTDGQPNTPAQVFATNAPYYYNINNTTTTVNRLRVLARFGLEARITDTLAAGLRVATGGAGGGSNPGSENVTLGNYDTRFAVGLDRAYLRYKPVPWATVTGGRLGNPFFTPTDVIWAETLSLEGVVTKFSHDFNDDLDGILIAGAFPIQQRDNQVVSAGVSSDSKWLFGYQTGLDWRFARPDDLKVAVAFYDYRHVEGILAPDVNNIDQFDWSAAGFRQKGNQTFDIHALVDQPLGNAAPPVPPYIGLVSKFRELNLSTSLDLGNFAPTHVILKADYVRNLGFHAQEIQNRVGAGIVDPSELIARVTGYQVKLVVGHDKLSERGDWQAYSGYRNLERDAVLDAYNDQDFNLGGTNAKGYFLGGGYDVAKNTAVRLRWLSANQVDGPPLSIDVIQLDLTTSF